MVNGLPPSECDYRTARVQKIGLDLNEKSAFTVAEPAFGSAVQGRGDTQARKEYSVKSPAKRDILFHYTIIPPKLLKYGVTSALLLSMYSFRFSL